MNNELQEIFDILKHNGINPLDYDIQKIKKPNQGKQKESQENRKLTLLPKDDIEEIVSYIKSNDKVVIYTDGSCIKNDGFHPSTHAFIVTINGLVAWEHSSHEKVSTNNRGELMAIVKASQVSIALFKKDGYYADIRSDSKYAINSLFTWSRSWLKDDGRKNIDIFRLFHKRTGRHVTKMKHNIKWIKGHSGNKYNDMVDELCTFEYDEM